MAEREDQKHLPEQKDLPGIRAVDDKIRDRDWELVYDKKGLQKNNGYRHSEWYVFNIENRAGEVIGEYHIHPTRRGYASGNFRLKCKGAFGSAAIGSARDWQGLCDWVSDDVDRYHGYGKYHRRRA